MSENRAAEFHRKLLRYAAVLMSVCLASGAVLGVLFYFTQDLIARKEMITFLDTLNEAMGGVEELKVIVEWPAQGPLPEGAVVEAETPDGGRFIALDAEAFEEHFKKVDRERAIFIGRLPDGVRYVAMGSQQGYQSRIIVLAAVDAPEPEKPVGEDPLIHRVAVVSSAETPGLGENIKRVESETSLWAALAGRGSGGAAPRRPGFQQQFSNKHLSDLPGPEKWDTESLDRITGATITSLATANAVRAAVERIVTTTRRLYE